MHLLPDAAEPDDTQVHDHLTTRDGPGHARAFEPLGEHGFTGGLCDARANRKALAAVVPIAPPMCALFQGGVGLIIVLGLPPQPVLPPQGRCRLSHPCDPVGCGLHVLAHLFRPGAALGRRAKERLRQRLDVQTGMIGVHNASPRELTPRALGYLLNNLGMTVCAQASCHGRGKRA